MTECNNKDKQMELKKADIGIRICAVIIDYIIVIAILFIPPFHFSFGNMPEDLEQRFLMFQKLMKVILFVYCLKDCIKGASIGKRVLGLTVRNASNSSEVPSVPKLFLRNIFTFIWPVEFLVLVCSADNTKIGDKITRTNVFYQEKKLKDSVIIIGVVLALFIFIASFLLGISSKLKNDSSYKMALQHIETNSELASSIGEIKGYGFFPNGSVSHSSRGDGQAVFSIKVIGSKKTIYVHIQMEKKADEDWEITHFEYDN